jgi:hypothetical protein
MKIFVFSSGVNGFLEKKNLMTPKFKKKKKKKKNLKKNKKNFQKTEKSLKK